MEWDTIEGAGEADHRLAHQTEFFAQCRIRFGAEVEGVGVDRIGNHGDLVGRQAARHDVAAQALADGGDLVRATQRHGFETPGQAVAQAAFGRRTVIDGGILPGGAHLVDHGNPEPTADLNRRQRVEHRRVRMQDVRANLLDHLGDTRFVYLHFPQFAQTGQALGQRARRAVEVPAVHVVFATRGHPLARRGEMKRLPAERALLAKYRDGPKGVAAMQRQRVIEDMENPHRLATSGTPARTLATTSRRPTGFEKASPDGGAPRR